MPFGKYKGHNLDELPDDYLLWVIANIPLRDPLGSAITEEMALRGYEELPLPPAPAPRPLKHSRETEEGGAWTMGGVRKGVTTPRGNPAKDYEEFLSLSA
jgi:uncharacterized protein (DUF3820 family)